MRRERERPREAAFYRGLLEFCGAQPELPRRRRRAQPRQPVLDAVINVSSDTSEDDVGAPVLPPPVLIDLDSSLETLPDIDPRPQHQLPAQQLPDLGPLDVTRELLPPPRHQAFREAVVLLQRLQLPPLQRMTPPPELQPRPQTPPPEEEEQWQAVEVEVQDPDGHQYTVLVAHPLVVQQPRVEPVPEHVPTGHQPPPPMPAVNWALVAQALFTIAEAEHQQAAINLTN